MAFTSSEKIVSSLKKKLCLNENIIAITKIWDKELGQLAKNVVLEGMQNGYLIVGAKSSSHFQEINLQKRKITNKINQYFGKEKIVKGIKARIKR